MWSSEPDSSPMAAICSTMVGNTPVAGHRGGQRRAGGDVLLDLLGGRTQTELPEAPPTESSASTSGTPAANMVDSVRVQRAMTDLLIRSPNTGNIFSSSRSMHLHLLGALPGLEEEVEAAEQQAEDGPPPLDEELGHRDHDQRGAGRSAPKEVNTSLKAGITKIMITVSTTKATTTAIGYISADLIFCLMARSFLVDRQAVEQRFQDAAGLAGFHQVAVQRVEVQRVLAEGRRQAGAGLDVGAGCR